jgi:hypothetical protein
MGPIRVIGIGPWDDIVAEFQFNASEFAHQRPGIVTLILCRMTESFVHAAFRDGDSGRSETRP